MPLILFVIFQHNDLLFRFKSASCDKQRNVAKILNCLFIQMSDWSAAAQILRQQSVTRSQILNYRMQPERDFCLNRCLLQGNAVLRFFADALLQLRRGARRRPGQSLHPPQRRPARVPPRSQLLPQTLGQGRARCEPSGRLR